MFRRTVRRRGGERERRVVVRRRIAMRLMEKLVELRLLVHPVRTFILLRGRC